VDVQHGNAEQSHSSFSSAKNTGVILRFNDLIVLAKRIEVCPFSNKKVNFGGYWSPFCGAVEEGETHEEAAVREVLEETGLVIDKNKLKILSRIRDLALFEYSLDKLEDIQLDYEHTESGYFRIEYINTLPTPMDEEIIQIIKKL
jgi:8-oxo-dGTP pyrophosphatase MutT (NUDIX family)